MIGACEGENENENEEVKGEGWKKKRLEVLMWGYLPGVSQQKSPLISPVPVAGVAGDSWKDVCSGGCGFAMAISESGKLITWGCAEDEGQSYLTSGKHGETPEPFPVPTEATITKAAAGWAHCVSITDMGEVFTWGWKECVPSGKVTPCTAAARSIEEENLDRQSPALAELESPRSHGSKSNSGLVVLAESKKAGDEGLKRRKLFPIKHEFESSFPLDENLSAPPCLVGLDPGVKIISVAAGGRHTLALSDVGQVWGWGYGGEGQLGLGSRIKIVASPQLIPCMDSISHDEDRSSPTNKALGSYVKGIASGGRHSAVVTDTGLVITFGWGLYGQCGQGNTSDLLRPTPVPSLMRTRVEVIATGLWHTVCICDDGHVYSFGGNQFGQLGFGITSECETLPRLLEAPVLENKRAIEVSCGARHSAILTDDARIYTWGWNKYGQLGLGDTIDRNTPVHVPVSDGLPKHIACGWWHTLLLTESLS